MLDALDRIRHASPPTPPSKISWPGWTRKLARMRANESLPARYAAGDRVPGWAPRGGGTCDAVGWVREVGTSVSVYGEGSSICAGSPIREGGRLPCALLRQERG